MALLKSDGARRFSELYAHPFQVGRDEDRDFVQVFQIAPLAVGHVGDVATPRGLGGFFSRLFEPDLDYERMGIVLE